MNLTVSLVAQAHMPTNLKKVLHVKNVQKGIFLNQEALLHVENALQDILVPLKGIRCVIQLPLDLSFPLRVQQILFFVQLGLILPLWAHLYVRPVLIVRQQAEKDQHRKQIVFVSPP